MTNSSAQRTTSARSTQSTSFRIATTMLALTAVLATGACGSSDAAEGSAKDKSPASSVDKAVTGASGSGGEEPDACTLLTPAELKTATGVTYGPGEGTDYDNTCRFDGSSDRVTVAVKDRDSLEDVKEIAKDVAPVAGLPGATRVDAVVYFERDGVFFSVAIGLPGFYATERDVAAVEKLAKLAAAKV
jgi:ABC-type glycerol-3-phosphate transport system substrate-binding protein